MPLRTPNYHWLEVPALENKYYHLTENNQAAQDHCLSVPGFCLEMITVASFQDFSAYI